MYRRTASTTRSAFTLVELLVVITIIGLLMGLILPAIQKVRVSGKRAQTGADISQLSAAAASFKQEFKFYPPDVFDGNSPAGIAILQQMYPRWNGLGYTSPNPVGQPLTGIECLIYFTTGPDNIGWAIDSPLSPTTAAKSKKGPYFEMPAQSAAPFRKYVYNDAFGSPYAYFVSAKGGKYETLTQAPGSFSTYPDGATFGPLAPLQDLTSLKYVNSDSVQIISAGADKKFGSGAGWKPGTGVYGDAGLGADDMANFYGGKQLGAE